MFKTLFLLAIGSWLVLGMLFLAYPTVRRLKRENHSFGIVVLVPIYLALVIGLVADVIFNALWGTVIFRELPKEWSFTDRLKRHWHGGDKVQMKRALPWVDRVNAIDPGHV